MKNLTILFLLLIGTISTAQNVKLSLTNSVDIKKHEYIMVDENNFSDIPKTILLGSTYALQTEFGISKKIAIFTGFSYSNRDFKLPFYLTSSYEENNPNSILYCYCFEHPVVRHALLTIPIGIKLYPISFKGLHPYVVVNTDITFRSVEDRNYDEFKFKELFKGRLSELATSSPGKYYLQSFRLKMAFGLAIDLSDKISFILEHSLALFDLKKINELVVADDDRFVPNEFIGLGRLSFGGGFSFSF